MKNVSMILYDDHIIDYKIGNQHAISFDCFKAWAFKFDYKNLDFYHVHSDGTLECSKYDENCVLSMAQMFGGPTRLNILTFENDDIFDLSYLTKCYISEDSETITSMTNPNWKLSSSVLLSLKALSIGNFDER
jgi:hypothetical protein